MFMRACMRACVCLLGYKLLVMSYNFDNCTGVCGKGGKPLASNSSPVCLFGFLAVTLPFCISLHHVPEKSVNVRG